MSRGLVEPYIYAVLYTTGPPDKLIFYIKYMNHFIPGIITAIVILIFLFVLNKLDK